jgi:hypothetical protein
VNRVLWFAPRNIHLEPIIEGLKELNCCELTVAWYGIFHDTDNGALDVAQQLRPDLVLYTGQNGGAMISTHALCRIKQICPTVLLVHDGSDTTWARLLHEYREREAFTTIVNIDGNPDWEHGTNDITALTPTAQGFYE